MSFAKANHSSQLKNNMTRFEFHACDAENESLRIRLQENKKSARLIYNAIANFKSGHYITVADLNFIKEQLKSIIQ